jgi:hypothetical protein
MSRLIRAGTTAVVIIGGVGFAAAQRASGKPELTATQQRTVRQPLANSPAQPAPEGPQPQVRQGSRFHDCAVTSGQRH